MSNREILLILAWVLAVGQEAQLTWKDPAADRKQMLDAGLACWNPVENTAPTSVSFPDSLGR